MIASKYRRSYAEIGSIPARHPHFQSVLFQEVLRLFREGLSEPLLEGVAVTELELLPDGRHARLGFTLPPELASTGPAPVEEALKRASGFIRSQLAVALRLRRVPHLRFVYLGVAPRGCSAPEEAPAGSMDDAQSQERGWRQGRAQLQLVVDEEEPSLPALPPSPDATSWTDEYLPVIGASMASLVAILRVFAQQGETILLSGPTGAGKSRLARWCHEHSSRRGGRFESLDLMTVPEELQMSELFGWRKGAFSGAVKDNPGCLARAEGGTLFIDEIDKLSLKAQAGLLHVLEERSYRSLGDGGGEHRANVRFIVGTNANLLEAVRRGTFREDLYYRINVLPVRVPSLDERRDELGAWARYMLARHHREKSPSGVARLAPDAEQRLAQRSWPGNLRQLDNIVRRAYTLAMLEQDGAQDMELREAHIQQALAYEGGAQSPALAEALCQAARAFVLEAQRRQGPLDIDLAESFRGFVLAEAVHQVGREEAFRLLGRELLVKSRNHLKALRQELKKAKGLCTEFRQPVPAVLSEAEGDELS